MAGAGSGPCTTSSSLPTAPTVSSAISPNGLAGFSGSRLAFGVRRAPRPRGGECCWVGGSVWRERSGGWEGAARGAERAGWMSAHFGPLLSEVALAVDVKEEVSWQKEKIERVVQFPPINNPGGHGYLLVGGSACSPAGSWESSPSVGVVISEAPLPPPHEGASWPPGRGQNGPLSPGEHQRQRLGPFGEAGRQHGRMGSLLWLGTWALNSGGACSPMGMKRLHWEGAGPLGALWPCPPVSCRAQTELGQPRV
ncbi:hypothetical protein PAL_GLEAN10022786 [Pteropus alecto]|uniref:Uncharacterized protein n=1 Tax=Pteropus alecto TaxID=9402 RepID=L5K6X4_PTEAL|nr:hypothetical protein PAL_GLEAN10022786 [Pteropus alecto]